MKRGLYKRYDGKYVFVLGCTHDVSGILVRYVFLPETGLEEFSMPLNQFLGKTYTHTLKKEDGFLSTVERLIKEHPYNVTGQEVCHELVTDFSEFGRKEVSDTCFEEYVVGVPVSSHNFDENRYTPDYIDIKAICEDIDEARKILTQKEICGFSTCKIYKREYEEVV